MPPPQSTQPPFQRSEGLLAEFLADGGVLRRGGRRPDVLLVRRICHHVAHRFHGVASSRLTRKYLSPQTVFSLGRFSLTHITRGAQRSPSSPRQLSIYRFDEKCDEMKSASGSRYIVRLFPVNPRASTFQGPAAFARERERESLSYPTRWMSSIEVTNGAADREISRETRINLSRLPRVLAIWMVVCVCSYTRQGRLVVYSLTGSHENWRISSGTTFRLFSSRHRARFFDRSNNGFLCKMSHAIGINYNSYVSTTNTRPSRPTETREIQQTPKTRCTSSR